MSTHSYMLAYAVINLIIVITTAVNSYTVLSVCKALFDSTLLCKPPYNSQMKVLLLLFDFRVKGRLRSRVVESLACGHIRK